MVRNPITGECENIVPETTEQFAVSPPVAVSAGAASEPCPFGGCGNNSNGKNSTVINNYGGGQCQCCENKQPIIINNIIPVDVLRAVNSTTLTPGEAANIPVNPIAERTPAAPSPAPVIHVHVPPQAAPQVNLSMPDIEIPPINEQVPHHQLHQAPAVETTTAEVVAILHQALVLQATRVTAAATILQQRPRPMKQAPMP
jgi:hypothetical protein